MSAEDPSWQASSRQYHGLPWVDPSPSPYRGTHRTVASPIHPQGPPISPCRGVGFHVWIWGSMIHPVAIPGSSFQDP